MFVQKLHEILDKQKAEGYVPAIRSSLFFVYACSIMLFFTKTSPLFSFNPWVDSNAFFTMGKGMANGLVPYRDLFEQKGPLLYFYHEIAYFISNTSFTGVYMLECIFLFFSMVLMFKLSSLYAGKRTSAIIAVLFPALILNENAFLSGDSAEEFCIPFLLLLLYSVLKHFRLKRETFSTGFYLVNGLSIGAVLWTKYTLLGAWIGFYLVIAVICIYKGKWKELIQAVVYTASGLVIASVPWIGYFGMHHALHSLFSVYFIFNMVSYPSEYGFLGKLLHCAINIGKAFGRNPAALVLTLAGFIDFMFTKKYLKQPSGKLMLFSIILFLLLGVYYGGRDYYYYFLIITPLSGLGLITIAGLLKRVSFFQSLNKDYMFLTYVFFTALAIAVCFSVNHNILGSKFYVKERSPQENFAEIMNSSSHPTLLNYGFLDGGFYLKANIVPTIKYFERQNISYDIFPENMNEQNRYLREKKVRFAVVRTFPGVPAERLRIPYIHQNYRVVAEQPDHERIFKYVLFQAK
ncbi:hypothetical protein [Bacillus sp. MUM 13]|uniref:hypothetical protein n=1 Tax=Bacillus sp. MUM 13 TaxID=1678001 RepID=UPI000A58E728|nr:hypothetical protein [Bacillus sp. MUM 13]